MLPLHRQHPGFVVVQVAHAHTLVWHLSASSASANTAPWGSPSGAPTAPCGAWGLPDSSGGPSGELLAELLPPSPGRRHSHSTHPRGLGFVHSTSLSPSRRQKLEPACPSSPCLYLCQPTILYNPPRSPLSPRSSPPHPAEPGYMILSRR
ncbi:uncharacterized protein J3D65DRAFT_628666 [Phyllosticta citribraziliensis]|uniref:Uncharacterized protein n=1 Tax=Phyllosticta citribraziliensis TaxID=989973 RepID=A0ABR1LMP1_9PEZI